VRLVFEPKSRTVAQQELITTLLAHTSLETSAPINLTMVGLRRPPVQKSLRQMLVEWIDFRQATVARRTRSTGWTRCWTASMCWKAGSWCC
jgi:topoisomerase-4 subunit A